MMQLIECKSCAYFDKGRCRRYPPVVGSMAVKQGYAPHTAYNEPLWLQPRVDPEDWCGEHSMSRR